MLDITQTEVDRTLTVRYTGELDQHTARQTIERSEDLLYRLFGKNAELLIDHAWGWEPTTVEAIKAYRPSTNSISSARCGCDFRVRGTPPQPQRVFDAAGLPQVIVFERGE